MRQNYPNPLNPETMISFDLPEEAKVTLEVYNLMGSRLRT
ncbi:MAG: T9SS type A sorting domain-containing protein [bacterium]|nr:MAG: T9SS type A sorting domain-containing protein [bacterium]